MSITAKFGAYEDRFSYGKVILQVGHRCACRATKEINKDDKGKKGSTERALHFVQIGNITQVQCMCTTGTQLRQKGTTGSAVRNIPHFS